MRISVNGVCILPVLYCLVPVFFALDLLPDLIQERRKVLEMKQASGFVGDLSAICPMEVIVQDKRAVIFEQRNFVQAVEIVFILAWFLATENPLSQSTEVTGVLSVTKKIVSFRMIELSVEVGTHCKKILSALILGLPDRLIRIHIKENREQCSFPFLIQIRTQRIEPSRFAVHI